MTSARAAFLVPALLWLWLLFHLHYEWSLNAQYNYGWAVPVLGAFMFYLRWGSRPAAKPNEGAWIATAGWLLLALLLPLRAIEEANPDWRLLSWTLAFVVVGYSLLVLFRHGGSGWVGHFAFPVCFPLVAVPWLVQIENVIVQGLTRAVAFAAVEIAGWIGVGAYQIGNIIELHNGFVGVDEACSGVKTLQAAIMVSLALGELFQLTAAKRVVLIVGGCTWVFICNVLRATTLVVITARHGNVALDRWHDTVGTLVLVVGMGGLVALGWLLRPKEMPAAGEAISPRDLSATRPHRHAFVSPVAAVVWLLAVFVTTELWYRSHEKELVELRPWHARWPEENATTRKMPIADTTRAILRYDEASSAAWEGPRGVHWWSFFARWEPQRAALQLVRSHSPEICLPAVGRTFRRELPRVVFQTDAAPLQFRAYEFEQNSRPLFVFVCIQEDKTTSAGPAAIAGDWSARGRLLAVARGQRNLGQRLLEIAVIGFDDFPRAREAVASAVSEMVESSATTG